MRTDSAAILIFQAGGLDSKTKGAQAKLRSIFCFFAASFFRFGSVKILCFKRGCGYFFAEF